MNLIPCIRSPKFPAAVLAAAFVFALALPFNAPAQDFTVFGFNTNIDELEEFISFQQSASLDPAGKILADWSTRLEKLQLVELERSENRYYDSLDLAFKEVKHVSEHFDVADHLIASYGDRIVQKRGNIDLVPFTDWKSFAKPRG